MGRTEEDRQGVGGADAIDSPDAALTNAEGALDRSVVVPGLVQVEEIDPSLYEAEEVELHERT
jgi:hypothetical protein